MRVISGEFKGRVLQTPRASKVRPTTGRVREALFSALQARVDLSSISVLDLYAGSGALGLEALSRGAQFACFVEKEKNLCAAIEKTILDFGLRDRSVVIHRSVPDALVQIKSILLGAPKFDLVFVDPPYDAHPGLAIGEWLVNTDLIADETIVVLESRRGFEKAGNATGKNYQLLLEKEKRYGDTTISYCTIRREK